ncbi:MAG: alpha/beta hydrolase [Acidisphaera sp.]|nr:alpha/beta hydrolase [Acidisphaera sp.]
MLLHGNAVSGDDFATSSLLERVAREHRVIVFDRPGFGQSERPRGRVWAAQAQAELIHKALVQLGVRQAVVVGHSWGAIVALSLALNHPDDAAGLVLLAGYYFATLRPDVLLVSLGAVPIVGDVLRFTVLPLLGALLMPLFKRQIFAPGKPTRRFKSEYSEAMTLRPSEIRAISQDTAAMLPSVTALRRHYDDIAVPTAILAAGGDKVVGRRQAERLHKAIPGSSLQFIDGVGHMLHHIAPLRVLEAIRAVARPNLEMPLAAD